MGHAMSKIPRLQKLVDLANSFRQLSYPLVFNVLKFPEHCLKCRLKVATKKLSSPTEKEQKSFSLHMPCRWKQSVLLVLRERSRKTLGKQKYCSSSPSFFSRIAKQMKFNHWCWRCNAALPAFRTASLSLTPTSFACNLASASWPKER